MRAALWIAASGFLLAAGSAYAGAGLPYGHDDTGHPDGMAEAAPTRGGVTLTGQGPRAAAHDRSKVQPAEAGPREKAGAGSYAVTADPEHPGGEFPVGG